MKEAGATLQGSARTRRHEVFTRAFFRPPCAGEDHRLRARTGPLRRCQMSSPGDDVSSLRNTRDSPTADERSRALPVAPGERPLGPARRLWPTSPTLIGIAGSEAGPRLVVRSHGMRGSSIRPTSPIRHTRADGHLMDGGHRIAKAWLEGAASVNAVRFVETPEPDWIQEPGDPSGRLVVVCGNPRLWEDDSRAATRV